MFLAVVIVRRLLTICSERGRAMLGYRPSQHPERLANIKWCSITIRIKDPSSVLEAKEKLLAHL